MTSPDVLNDLHTLRSLANTIKRQCDDMRQWQLAALVASISEQASEAIDRLNQTTTTETPAPENEFSSTQKQTITPM